MWSASIDPGRQLLQLAFSKRVDVAQATECAQRLRELIQQLQPGFTMLSDLSDLDEMDLACEPIIGRLMDDLDQRGVRKIVRVVPDPRKDIGFGIMSLFHYGEQVRTITFSTLEEAKEHVH